MFGCLVVWLFGYAHNWGYAQAITGDIGGYAQAITGDIGDKPIIGYKPITGWNLSVSLGQMALGLAGGRGKVAGILPAAANNDLRET